LDREALALRNRRLAEALHHATLKQRLRRDLLKLIAKAPVAPLSAKSNRVLIIRPDHLGDMLLTTPAIKSIKQRRPELSIHVLCGPWCAEILENYDEVDQALPLPFPGFRRDMPGAGNPYRLALEYARQLRRIGYDSAIIMRPDHWWGGLLAFLAGIPERIGYDLPSVSPFLTVSRKLEHQHVLAQNLRLAESLGDMPAAEAIQLDFPLRADDRDSIEQYLEERKIPAGKAIVCIHPGAGTASKVWRSEKWAAVADAVSNEYDAAIVFTGAAAESELIGDIAARMEMNATNMAGSTKIGQLGALYRRSLAVLGCDSGAMHLAAAVRKPTVTLFGPADPVEFAPWGDRRRQRIVTSDIGCRPCRILDWGSDNADYHPCVRDIRVCQVLEALRGALNEE
jgi:lipopolysaccharide heptosyltransferase II